MMFYWMKRFKEKRLQKKLKRLFQDRQANNVNDIAIEQEIQCLKLLADFYRKCRQSKYYPYAREMEEAAHRNAAILGDSLSELWLGQNILRHAQAREQWQLDVALANDFNDTQAKSLYQEAHRYLESARKKNVEAERLLGLCYIHGWGVAVDRKKGFSFIVESINREDSWDKLPEIFSKIGLNKPEFLKELIKFRTSSNGEPKD